MQFLVRVFAKKLAKDGINVNCIIPGFIRTGAWENVFKVRCDTSIPNDPLVMDCAWSNARPST